MGTIPTEEAITVCLYCGTLLEFSKGGYVHAPRDRLSEIPDVIREVIEATIGRAVVGKQQILC
jgi:hypothetical protein